MVEYCVEATIMMVQFHPSANYKTKGPQYNGRTSGYEPLDLGSIPSGPFSPFGVIVQTAIQN